jgi:transcription initiation factor TFIIIB Brf1 subunit/transcription initiation factor TFIIB
MPSARRDELSNKLLGEGKNGYPAGILIDKEVNLIAKVAVVLQKNSYAANVAVDRSEVAKRKDVIAFNSTLKEDLLPEIERITQSLLKVQEIMSAAHLLWPNKKTARKINMAAVEIINHVCKKKFSFINGKALRCIMGGLFYLLGFRYDDPRKQREIAIALQITDVSIRSFYKKWLNEFPDLFQDIVAKENCSFLLR